SGMSREASRAVGCFPAPTGLPASSSGLMAQPSSQVPNNGAARLWDTTSGRAIGGLIVDERPAGFSPDGRAFLTLGNGRSVDLLDASTGRVLRRLLNLPSPATCAAFRGDGGLVAVGC